MTPIYQMEDKEDSVKRYLAIGALALAALLTLPAAAHAETVPPTSDPESVEVSETETEVTVGRALMYGVDDSALKSFTVDGERRLAIPAAAPVICQAAPIFDHPHISTSKPQGPRAVQGHGSWNKGNCNATHAKVTTQMDRRNPIGLMQAVGTKGEATLPSEPSMGLPSSNRVTARYVCDGLAAADFQTWTKIDMVGLVDSMNPNYSAMKNLACG